jgi:hypothetical protein
MPTSKIKLYIDIITVNAAKILGKDSVIIPYTFQCKQYALVFQSGLLQGHVDGDEDTTLRAAQDAEQNG